MANHQKYYKKYYKISTDMEDDRLPYSKPPKDKKNSGKNKLTAKQGSRYVVSVIGTTFLTLFLIVVITVCVVAVALTVYITQFADSMYDVDLEDVELSYSSFIYTMNKETGQYEEILQLSADENRIWVDLEDVPQHTIDALVAKEDKRYYDHAGVDWTRTIYIGMTEMMGGGEKQQGGSTITQQLVRDITKDNQVNIGRKLREIFRALSLEQKYSKHDIIESYINRVAFGNTIYGLGSAAQHYFDKEVGELTIAESCVLIGLLPSPVYGNPYNNPEEARLQQLETLRIMYEEGYISYAQYQASKEEQVRFRLPVGGDWFGYIDERYEESQGLQSENDNLDDPYFQNSNIEDLIEDPFEWNEYEVRYNWYVDAALKEITNDLAELKDISYESAAALVKKGGYKIYLSVDTELQEKVEAVFNDPMLIRTSPYPAGTPARDTIQAAFVLMDTQGNVVALAGGLGDKPGNDVFNRAVMSKRNVGSTIKPIAVYAPGVDMDKITYSTMMLDAAGKIDDPDNPGSLKSWPKNYEGNYGLGGSMTAQNAVMVSANTVSARTLHMVGVRNSFNFLYEKLGVKSLDPVKHMDYSPLATGSAEIKLHELAGAYQIFGTGGVYYKPAFYSKIEDQEGKVILAKDVAGTQAIGSDSAWVVNRMIYTVVNGGGGGTGARANLSDYGIETIGKTGTANDMSDLLFCGLTPDYVGTLRIGYDDNRMMRSYSEDHWRSLAAIWRDVMVGVIPLTPSKFDKLGEESGSQIRNYCTYSGLVAGPNCASTMVGYYKATNIPPICPHDGSEWTLVPPGSQERDPLYRAQ